MLEQVIIAEWKRTGRNGSLEGKLDLEFWNYKEKEDQREEAIDIQETTLIILVS